MVKVIHFSLDDRDYDRITKVKGERTWPRFLLDTVEGPADVEEKVERWLKNH